MQYFSTNKQSAHVSFREATLLGQPDDKGLFFPTSVPKLTEAFWSDFSSKSQAQTAFEVIKPYVGDGIDDESLFEICSETVNFDFPLVEVTDRISSLELFHGATLAFKDVGARFMSRCLQHFSRDLKTKTVVLVATSGDTGGAVANGFYDVEGVDVVILYPKGKVSRVQELQLTTLGKNIIALEVEGSFDDCQALAKRALADASIKESIFLTSANSINVARWLPQQFYYFYALQHLRRKSGDESAELPIVCVPSGNFGNICAGVLASVSGLPVRHFIAACNGNDVIPEFFRTGELVEKKSVATLSNAMDVAKPSNFVRIMELFGQSFPDLKQRMSAVSVTDEQTVETMRSVFEDFKYVLDPHGAVGFRALDDYLSKNPDETGIFLETAHPVKFDSVEEILGTFGSVPESVRELYEKPKQSIEMKADYEDLKDLLLSRV